MVCVCIHAENLEYYSGSAPESGMIFIYCEKLQFTRRMYIAERTIFIDCYLETSMSHSFVRNDFVFLLFYYTMSILKKKFKGTIVVLSKQLLMKHLHFTTRFLFCFSKRTRYKNVIEIASISGT